jgi:hypothetical protein
MTSSSPLMNVMGDMSGFTLLERTQNLDPYFITDLQLVVSEESHS